MLGFDALGRLALGQASQGGFTLVLPAAPGSFALSGVAATFRVTEATVTGSYALSGKAAPLVIKEAAATGAFALTGVAASFKATFNAAPGAYALTGYPVNEPIFQDVEPGAFVWTGNDAPLIRTGYDREPGYMGIGHYLEEMERARQLARITRKIPPPVDRRTAPQFEPLRAAPIAPPAVDMLAVQKQRTEAAAAATEAATKRRRRDEEALLLLAC